MLMAEEVVKTFLEERGQELVDMHNWTPWQAYNEALQELHIALLKEDWVEEEDEEDEE
jgi:hypothetical protein